MLQIILRFLVVAFVAALVAALPINNAVVESNNGNVITEITAKGISWLQTFGYYTRPDSRFGVPEDSEPQISVGLRKLQRFAGLTETGILDTATKNLMNTSRCGVSDFDPMDNAKRKRRFILQGTYWGKKDLTWKLENESNDAGMTRAVVEDILSRAFNKWAQVTSLTFQKLSSGTADIMIKFATDYHQDPYPFDGRGNTLAHAYYPFNGQGISGDIHFDDAEEFTKGTRRGKNLLWVAVHEIGHSIGLRHSDIRGAIMYPWYQGYQGDDFPLTADDISGIRQLYGTSAPTTTSFTSTAKPSLTTQPKAKVCLNKIKTIFLGNDKRTYIINEENLYILGSNVHGIEEGPIALGEYFNGIKRADSAYLRGDGKTVFFSGNSYFVFDGQKKIEGPSKIQSYYTGLPDSVQKIDAAFVWNKNRKTYLFTGSQYYRFNPVSRKIDFGYPRDIKSAWKVPGNIDSVFSWRNGAIYFFKGTKYYRMMKTQLAVESGYPKDILTSAWIDCKADAIIASRGTAEQFQQVQLSQELFQLP